MTSIVSKLPDIQARLDALAAEHRVPGASLGIMSGDELHTFPTGVANVATGAPVTNETIFQIGSNTKVYTATLVMQLVDEGKVDLDAPATTYVPELKVDGDLSKVTVRMLLNHTSGIEGDYFEDFGRGEDNTAKYVASLKKIGFIHPPGAQWSYSNTAFTIAGRLIEKVTGESYSKVLKDRIYKPLGHTLSSVSPEEMVVRSTAAGHIVGPTGPPMVTPQPFLAQAMVAAGSIMASTPREVLGFVKMHLDGGVAPDGSRVLSEKSVKAMQTKTADMPASSGLGIGMGIGWILGEFDGHRVIAHGGGTVGQLSSLQVMADDRFGVCLLTNSTTGGALWRDLSRWIFLELGGVNYPELPKAPSKAPSIDLSKYEGTFERYGMELSLEVADGRATGVIKPTGSMAALQPPQHVNLVPIDKQLFVAKLPGGDAIAEFIDFDAYGRPGYVHVGGRIAKRVSAQPKAKAKGKAKAKAKAKAKPKARAKAKAKAKAKPKARAKAKPARRAPARRTKAKARRRSR